MKQIGSALAANFAAEGLGLPACRAILDVNMSSSLRSAIRNSTAWLRLSLELMSRFAERARPLGPKESVEEEGFRVRLHGTHPER